MQLVLLSKTMNHFRTTERVKVMLLLHISLFMETIVYSKYS